MKPFNFDVIRKGDILPCKDGIHKMEILTTTAKGQYCIAAICYGPDDAFRHDIFRYRKDGNVQWPIDGEDEMDLMLPDYLSLEVYVYKYGDDIYASSEFDSDLELLSKQKVNIL